MTSFGTMIDVTGNNLQGLLNALGSNFPNTIASYVTGTGGVPASETQFAAIANDCGVFRYDQSSSLSEFAVGNADGADIENGAGSIVAAVQAALEREAHNWYSWFYLSADNLSDARTAVSGAGLQRVQFIVANWSLSQVEAQSFLASNDDVVAVQWASPSSNPNMVVPGTRRTMAQLNVDLNVTRPGWFVKGSQAVTTVKTLSGLLVTSNLDALNVTSLDGKTWNVS